MQFAPDKGPVLPVRTHVRVFSGNCFKGRMWRLRRGMGEIYNYNTHAQQKDNRKEIGNIRCNLYAFCSEKGMEQSRTMKTRPFAPLTSTPIKQEFVGFFFNIQEEEENTFPNQSAGPMTLFPR